ncbi:hypothetical protein TNCV_2084581 [Trichonephila clavipes]|uniref:Uncharacterized protein n=1 Tax=Trichonephila clavipes TaxID=2585209 RepID=A0A8X6V1M6_TRICX|nr:hypothetical protein TNCV_2084581 [Trichonephila clavipes]
MEIRLYCILMGGRRSPRYNCSFYICPVYRKRISKECGGASGQRTLWRAKLYPCTACWPIGIVKFTARTLKRMIFRVVRSPLYKGWRENSRGFPLLLRLPEKPSTAGKRTRYPRSTPPSLSPLIPDK